MNSKGKFRGSEMAVDWNVGNPARLVGIWAKSEGFYLAQDHQGIPIRKLIWARAWSGQEWCLRDQTWPGWRGQIWGGAGQWWGGVVVGGLNHLREFQRRTSRAGSTGDGKDKVYWRRNMNSAPFIHSFIHSFSRRSLGLRGYQGLLWNHGRYSSISNLSRAGKERSEGHCNFSTSP